MRSVELGPFIADGHQLMTPRRVIVVLELSQLHVIRDYDIHVEGI
jgi:hypothetical protein